MFSDHMNKFDTASTGKLWVAAGVAVILCQLGAFAMVADGQVKKAEARESRLAVERVAVANCLESSAGAARHACIQQARAGSTAGGVYLAGNSNSEPSSGATRQMASNDGAAPVMGGLMPVSFAAN